MSEVDLRIHHAKPLTWQDRFRAETAARILVALLRDDDVRADFMGRKWNERDGFDLAVSMADGLLARLEERR